MDDIEARNPADVLKDVFEAIVPPELRAADWEENIAALRAYCEEEVPA